LSLTIHKPTHNICESSILNDCSSMLWLIGTKPFMVEAIIDFNVSSSTISYTWSQSFLLSILCDARIHLEVLIICVLICAYFHCIECFIKMQWKSHKYFLPLPSRNSMTDKLFSDFYKTQICIEDKEVIIIKKLSVFIHGFTILSNLKRQSQIKYNMYSILMRSIHMKLWNCYQNRWEMSTNKLKFF